MAVSKSGKSRFLCLRAAPATMQPMRSAALIIGMIALALPARSWAGWPDRVGTRALGMGGALRGAATGDAGPMLNPSGMSLARAYAVEGSYQLTNGETAHRPHVSVVDSTSGFNIAGGLYYTYLTSKPNVSSQVSGHEAGASLAVPFGQRLSVGGQLKYFRLVDEYVGEADAMRPDQRTRGFTFDLGATVRPHDVLTLGVVGYNLADKSAPAAPLAVGFGAGLMPLPGLLLGADAVIDFTTYDDTRGNLTSYMGGAEYSTTNGLALRAGGGRNGQRASSYVSGGVSAVSEMAALDIGFSRDLSGTSKLTVFAISVRLFAATAINPG